MNILNFIRIDTDLYIYVLLAANTLVLYGGLLTILRLRRLCRQQERMLECPPGIALTDVEEPSADDARKQTLNLLRIEKQLLSLRSELAAHAAARSETQASERLLPLENAVRMARNGASVDDLTRSCGLNIGEAQLIRKMHGHAAIAERARA